MLGLAQIRKTLAENRSDPLQPLGNFARIAEPAHLRIARDLQSIYVREIGRQLLTRQQQRSQSFM